MSQMSGLQFIETRALAVDTQYTVMYHVRGSDQNLSVLSES